MLRTIRTPLVAGVAAVSMLLVASASHADVVNVVTNGTFESPDNLTGWLQFANNGTIGIAQDNGPSASGSQSAQLVANASGGASFPLLKIERLAPGLLTNGGAVKVSYDARAPIQTVDFPNNAGAVVFIAELFSEFTLDGATNEILQGPPNFLTSSWQTFTFNTFLGADASGGVSLLFKADCGANPGCRFTANIDNVKIETNVVPAPAAVWLLGTGCLALLGRVARRKMATA